MDGGAYARVYLFTLEDDQKVVGRVVLPVRESVRTEAEVAAMELLRGTVSRVLLQSHICLAPAYLSHRSTSTVARLTIQ
jgi:hypothetical protein